MLRGCVIFHTYTHEWVHECVFIFQVEAVSTSVQDSSVLVQRSTLDLILFCFPFHMSQVKKKHEEKLLSV